MPAARFWRELGLAALPIGVALLFLQLGGLLTPLILGLALAGGLLAAALLALNRLRGQEGLRRWVVGLGDANGNAPASDPADGALVRPILDLARERRRLQRFAVNQERLLFTVIGALPDPVLLVDRDETVRHANAAARESFAVEPIDLPLGRLVRDPGLLATVRAALESRAAGTTVFGPPGDRTKRFAARVHPVDLNDGRTGALIVLREESEQVLIERMRSDFVANASHEIRTPLASLMGFIETLRGPARDDAEAREAFLATMAEETARLNRLVDDLLSLSRIELAAFEPPTAPVRVEAVIKRVLERVGAVAAAAGVALYPEIETPLPEIVADADQLHQLLLILIDNAIVYAASGEEVRVIATTTAKAPFDAGPLAGRAALILAVADRGPGIAKEHLPRLTERFYRVDKHRSRRGGGTGLGLAIAKHIVRRHRGHLGIESAVGRGSRFTVLLPLPSGPPRA